MYQVSITRAARKEAKSIPADQYEAIDTAIRSLADDPRPNGCKKLKGSDSLYRIRVGDYRVIYDVSDAKQTVTVARIRHRKDAYDA